MEIFLDTSDLAQIERWLRQGVIDGVTTNPSIMLKDGHSDLEAGSKEIAALIAPRPVSVEVITNNLDEMVRQAREFASWASNIVIKTPIVNEYGEPCLGVVKTLGEEGIRVNCTACMSFGQAVLGAKAGATYVSLFGGRISDEGHDAPRVIKMTREWLDLWGYKSKIIVGSIREVINIQDAAVAGAHVITIPPQLMAKMVDHKYSRYTVGQFVRDGERAFAQLEKIGS